MTVVESVHNLWTWFQGKQSQFSPSRAALELNRNVFLEEIYLTPLTGSILVVLAVGSGHLFRDNWKKQEDGWQRRAWLYGVLAGGSLLMLAFVPLKF